MNKNKSVLIKFTSYYKGNIKWLLLDFFFALLMTGFSIGTPFLFAELTQKILSRFNQGNMDITVVWKVSIGFFVLIICRIVGQFFVQYWGHLMGGRIENRMRKQAFAHMQKINTTYFDQTPSGKIVSRVVSDLKDIGEFAHHIPEDLFISFLQITAGFTTIFVFGNWIIGLVVLALYILIALFNFFQNKKFTKIRAEFANENTKLTSCVVGSADGIRETKSYTNHEHELNKFNIFTKSYFRTYSKNMKAVATWLSFTFAIMSIMTIVISLLAAIFLYYNVENMTPFKYTIAISVSYLLIDPLNRLSVIFDMFQNGKTSLVRFYDFMSNTAEDFESGLQIDQPRGDIEFKNVSFKYPNTDTYILKNFSLKIKQGQKIAFVGETGIGKSTILKVLLRFYPIESGDIMLDEKSIYELNLVSLRKNIAYIQQSGHMFYETISGNIKYGRLEAGQEEIEHAAGSARIAEVISELQEGYETNVGPNGIQLSGGQRQRISLARAFLKNAPIIALDEATSALDNVTEDVIKKAIEKVSQNKTLITVAHRLSTIKDSDVIILLGKGGHIKESGTYEELLAKKGDFFELSFGK